MAPITGLIKTEAAYEAALEEMDDLSADMPRPGTPRGNRFELLAILISRYEDEHHPIPDADPIALLRFAIEDMGRSQAELGKLLGSRGRASEIMTRKRPLTLDQIRTISAAWSLPLAALAAPYELHKAAA
jgi:HTH-type transcriptional regulator/antitoxin HigA